MLAAENQEGATRTMKRKRRGVHPVVRAEWNVREACADLAVAIETHRRAVTIDEICPSSDPSKPANVRWRYWTEKRLGAAIVSGSVVKKGERYNLTADGWDRVGGPNPARDEFPWYGGKG